LFLRKLLQKYSPNTAMLS